MEIKNQVAELLADAATGCEKVKDIVIQKLYDAELQRRVDAAIRCVSQLEEIERDLKKISKPDVETYNADGSVANTSYSKEKVEQIKNKTKEKEKLEQALMQALEKNDFNALLKV